MPGRRDFDIAFVGLKPGIHVFVYDVDDDFFVDRPSQEFRHCRAQVRLSLDKHPNFMMLKFEVSGEVDLNCDRCGNPIIKQLWDEFDLVVKMVDDPDGLNEKDEDPDVFYISKTESHLHVADWLYEFILLGIPAQRRCSDADAGGGSCDPAALEMLRKMEPQPDPEDGNPIWKDLDRFRNS
jgi:uncharacterized metal-binding protein YceD (DUF177 family)